ncbi:hypothetical protein GOODEAATRI_013910 [Goodea atripinnis]|uniref:Cation channel complex component UNC80 N-terminal domain-containing protein n=1 Tax=Goodea atripinnis TaxID=208336 RepID=A0ABV0NK29_9TELE
MREGSTVPYPDLPLEADQSFERVLVENKLHGLSPALSEAIQSISRWELVQAALPHVLHCTSILLSNRNKLGETHRDDGLFSCCFHSELEEYVFADKMHAGI